MSVDFTAILSHPFDDSDILTVPERLNADREKLGKAKSQYHAFIKQTGYFLLEDDIVWHWEEGLHEWKGNNPDAIWNSNNPIELVGSPLLRIHFGRGACDLSAPLGWRTFLTDSRFQIETRKVCFAIAQAFAGDKAIYLPDSASQVSVAADRVYENDNLQQIEDWLKQNIGEPSPTIEHLQELIKTEDWEGYFIDHFPDFSPGSLTWTK